jgi:hypothetical protein
VFARILLGLGVLLLAIQLVPVSRDNPPIQGEVPASPEVRALLERSCYDCHSRKSRWPWYAHVAPVSWLVTRDVHEARKHLDFTAWDTYSAKKRAKRLGEVWEEVDKGEMPLWFYVPLHPEARLSDADRALLHEWTRATDGGAPVREGVAPPR